MIELQLKQEFGPETFQVNDAYKMQGVLHEAGYVVGIKTIIQAYEIYSEEYYACGWYSIDGLSDESILKSLLCVLEPVNSE